MTFPYSGMCSDPVSNSSVFRLGLDVGDPVVVNPPAYPSPSEHKIFFIKFSREALIPILFEVRLQVPKAVFGWWEPITAIAKFGHQSVMPDWAVNVSRRRGIERQRK
jgi:hypothetical protein